jgi:putative DNA primase/helicase
VAVTGRWLHWSGERWQHEDTLLVPDRAREVCRAGATGNNDGRVTKSLLTAKTIAAVGRLAQADRRIAAKADQWDADPWLLNTPSGTIDPRDHLTKITGDAADAHQIFPRR